MNDQHGSMRFVSVDLSDTHLELGPQLDNKSAEVIRNTAVMFQFIKNEMREAAKRNDEMTIQFLRMQMFLVDEEMFSGWREARKEKGDGKHEQSSSG